MNGLTSLAAGALALVASVSTARADSFRLDRHRAAERPDDAFGVRRLGDIGQLRLGATASADYASTPLTAQLPSTLGSTREVSVVSDELVLKLDVSLGLWSRVVAFAGFDAPLWMRGEDLPAALASAQPQGASIGDIALGGRVRALGEADDAVALGVQAALLLPASGGATYAGEESVAVRPELIAELRPAHVRITGNVGAVLASGRAELVYGVALGAPIHPRVELVGELRGGLYQTFPHSETDAGLEWLLGGKLDLPSGLSGGVGAGTGILSSAGIPELRVVAQLGWLAPEDEELPEELEEQPAQPPVPDADGDGVADAEDECSGQAEDRDGLADEDGCPEDDADGDGLVDDVDSCAGLPEDHDHHRDQDGCPEEGADADADGVIDASDRCPLETEDADGFADDDGCLDADNDGDGVPDGEDGCPLEPGSAEQGGCAVRGEVPEEGATTAEDPEAEPTPAP